MGSARYKTSSDGCFRLYVQQTGISGNNAVLSAWIAVKNSSAATVQSINNPKITIGSTSRTGSVTSVSGASDWKTVYSVSGITYAYATGATGGSAPVSASGSLYFNGEDGGYWYSESVSAYYDLDTRTISGSLTATNAALNEKPTFTIGSYNSAYTYGISYSIGNASGTVATGISASTYNGWTVPQDLGAQIPAGYTGTITYTLTTYSGSTAVGTATTTASITVPSYSYTVAAPTASKGSYSTIGAYVAGKTKVDFAVPAPPAASYGATYTYTATITQGSSTLASQAFTASGTISATPTGTGTVTCTVTMTDSRGATKSNSASVTYVANTMPTVTLSAYRVGSSGSTTQDITGAYYYATASGTYNALTNNTCTLTLTTTSTGTASGSSGKVSKTASGSLATTNTLTVTAKVQDALGNVATATAIIPQGFAVVQFGTGSDHKGVSIGKVGQNTAAGFLEIGYDLQIDGNLNHAFNFGKSELPTHTWASHTEGWYRCFIIQRLASAPIGTIFETGSWNSSRPRQCIVDFACLSATQFFTNNRFPISGGTFPTKLRFVYIDSTHWAVDVYIPKASSSGSVGYTSVFIQVTHSLLTVYDTMELTEETPSTQYWEIAI